jgi:hypothetical protein
MADLRDLINQQANLKVDRDLLILDIGTQELRAKNNLPGAAAELAKLRSQLAKVDAELASISQQIAQLRSQSTSAGKVVRDDQAGYGEKANAQDPSAGPQILKNGRIQSQPDTTSGSTAIQPVSANNVDSGTNAPTRKYSETQGTAPGSNLQSPGPVLAPTGAGAGRGGQGGPTAAQATGTADAIPGGNAGVGASGDDSGRPNTGAGTSTSSGTNSTVSELNSINFGDVKPQPNILDQYSSYTYQASLYLMNKETYQRMVNTREKSFLGNAPLLVQSGGANTSARDSAFKYDYYIENIELKSFVACKGVGLAHNVSDVKMTIIEPNGITFLDNMSAAVQKFIGGGKSDINIAAQVYLLVVRFYGYDDQGNLVRGGVNNPNQTSDPNSFVEKWYPLQISNIKFKVQNKLVEYQIDASAIPYYVAAGAARGTLPFNMELSGQTLKDILAGPIVYAEGQSAVNAGTNNNTNGTSPANTGFANTGGGAAVGGRLRGITAATNQSSAETNRLLAAANSAAATASAPPKADAANSAKKTVRSGLMAALNQFQLDLVKDKVVTYPDEYNIEFAIDSLASAKITNPGSVNKSTTSMSTPGTAADQKLGAKQSMDSNSRVQGATAGMQIVQFIDTLLRNSSYIKDQQVVSINEKTGKEERTNINLKNTAWYKIGFKVEPKWDQFDKLRNDYAYKITYIVSPYKISQLFSPYFNIPLQTGAHKQYRYWFTGQNDSVLEYEENFNYLYYIVMSGQDLSDRPANAVDYLRFQYQTASGQSSMGAEGKTNEPASNAADQLYSPSDLGSCQISIVGDPAWLQQGETFFALAKNDVNYFRPFLADGTINFDSQQILFEVGYNKPEDYNILTGLAESQWGKTDIVSQQAYSTRKSGVSKILRTYLATSVTSFFSKGKFTQTIDGSLMPYTTPPKNVEVAATSPAAAATKTIAPVFAKTLQSSVTNPTPTSSLAKGVEQILKPAVQADNPSLTQLQASPVYIQARRNGATPAAALEAAKASFAAGTNNAANFAAPGIRTGTQLIVKDQ